MANTFNSTEMTSKAAIPAIHAGINQQTVSYTFAATTSGTNNVNMMKLPPGGKVIGVAVWTDSAAEGDAADACAVYDNHGNQYMGSAVAATTDVGVWGYYNDCGTRLTSSTHLYVQHTAKAGTGTSIMQIQLTALYTADASGD